MNTLVRNTATAFAVGLAIGAPLGMVGMASASSDDRDFEGVVKHVSFDNIKVFGVEGGRAETLSFAIDPKITKLTHDDGRSTEELKAIRDGDRVKIVFDQKLLGLRHADTIVDETIQMRQKS